MNYKKVKVIGLQRSGTNWLTQLIKINLNIEVYENHIIPFFKHAFPSEHQLKLYITKEQITTEMPIKYIALHPEELFIMVYKPLSKWIASIKKNKVDLPSKHPEIYKNDILDEEAARDLWKYYMQMWEKIKLPNFHIILYDEVLTDYIEFLKFLETKFNIKKNNLPGYKNVTHVPQSLPFLEKDKLKYLK